MLTGDAEQYAKIREESMEQLTAELREEQAREAADLRNRKRKAEEALLQRDILSTKVPYSDAAAEERRLESLRQNDRIFEAQNSTRKRRPDVLYSGVSDLENPDGKFQKTLGDPSGGRRMKYKSTRRRSKSTRRRGKTNRRRVKTHRRRHRKH
jgi:hypothetical protein